MREGFRSQGLAAFTWIAYGYRPKPVFADFELGLGWNARSWIWLRTNPGCADNGG